LANSDLLRAFIEGRVFGEDRGLLDVAEAVEYDSLSGCR
jgi:hypothetical protein